MSNSGSEDDALDIFQDAIVVLCKHIRNGKYDSNYQVSGFLYSVCRNLWINKAKRDSRTSYFPEKFDYGDFTDFSDEILTKEKERGLQAITQKLGQRCFELLKYAVFFKASSKEIIEKMGFSTANAVKTQKYKCKQKLLKILEDHPNLKKVVE